MPFCSNCGKELIGNEKFCSSCGVHQKIDNDNYQVNSNYETANDYKNNEFPQNRNINEETLLNEKCADIWTTKTGALNPIGIIIALIIPCFIGWLIAGLICLSRGQKKQGGYYLEIFLVMILLAWAMISWQMK